MVPACLLAIDDAEGAVGVPLTNVTSHHPAVFCEGLLGDIVTLLPTGHQLGAVGKGFDA